MDEGVKFFVKRMIYMVHWNREGWIPANGMTLHWWRDADGVVWVSVPYPSEVCF